MILANGPVIDAEHIVFEQLARPTDKPAETQAALADTLERTERDAILAALEAANGSRRAVAERLGISPRTLRYKLARMRSAGANVPAA